MMLQWVATGFLLQGDAKLGTLLSMLNTGTKLFDTLLKKIIDYNTQTMEKN